MKEKKLLIQVPDEIIRNTSCNLDSNAFATYTYIKFLYFRNYNNNSIGLDHIELKNKLRFADNRTLKKVLTDLHKKGIILEYIDKLPRKAPLNITFDPIPFDSFTFTQLPASIFYKINDIGVIGLRLLFYYESFINRQDDITRQFAFPAIETTSCTLGINKETVMKYNEILSKNKLIKIVKHKLEWSGDYDNLDSPLYTRYNNHYHVKLENI